jgi:putative flippase GtrA
MNPDDTRTTAPTFARPPVAHTARFARFVAAGGVAALTNFLVRIVLSHWLSYPLAIVLAFFAGMAVAFVLNRRFVFMDATNGTHEQATWFVIVNLVGVALTLMVSLLFADVVLPWLGVNWHRETLAHAVGICAPVFTSYLAHQKLSFRAR